MNAIIFYCLKCRIFLESVTGNTLILSIHFNDLIILLKRVLNISVVFASSARISSSSKSVIFELLHNFFSENYEHAVFKNSLLLVKEFTFHFS